jgi:hypothetical protein
MYYKQELFMLYAGITPDVQMSHKFYQLVSIIHGRNGMEMEIG